MRRTSELYRLVAPSLMKDSVGLPTAVGLLLAGEPVAGALDESRVDVRDFGHVVELHEAVGGEDLVGGSLSEPGEAAAGDLEGEQALVAVGDVALGLGVDFGCEFFCALHVVERENVGVGAGGCLLEAAAGHAEDAVHAFDDLAERAGIETDEDAGGVGDGGSGKVQFVLARYFRGAR